MPRLRQLAVGLGAWALVVVGAPATAPALSTLGPQEDLPVEVGALRADQGGFAPDGTLLYASGIANKRALGLRPPAGPIAPAEALPAGLDNPGGDLKVDVGPRGDAVLANGTSVAYRPPGGPTGAVQVLPAAPWFVRLNRAGDGVLLHPGTGGQVVAVTRPPGAASQWDVAGSQVLGTGSILALVLDPDGTAIALWVGGGTTLKQAVRPAGQTAWVAGPDLPLPGGLKDGGVAAQDHQGVSPSGWAVVTTTGAPGGPGTRSTEILFTVRAPGGTFSAPQSFAHPVNNFGSPEPAINDQGAWLAAYQDESGGPTQLVHGAGTTISVGGTPDPITAMAGAGHDLATAAYAGNRLRLDRYSATSAGPVASDLLVEKSSGGAILSGGAGGFAVLYNVPKGSSSSKQVVRVAPPDPNPLTVSLSAPVASSGDLLAVSLTATSDAADPVQVTFPSGMGAARDDTGAAGGPPVGLQAVVAPFPGFPASLGAGQSTQHTLVFEVTSPGTTRLVTRVRGVDTLGRSFTSDAALRVEAQLRPMSQWETRQAVAGAFTALAAKVQDARARAVKRLTDAVGRDLRRSKNPKARALLKPTARERGLAQQTGLPAGGLAWMSNAIREDRRIREGLKAARPGYAELTTLFVAESSDHFLRKVDKSLGNVADKVLVTPGLFWRDYLRGVYNGQEGTINAEMADAASEVYTKGTGALAEAARFYGSEDERKYLLQELPKIYDEAAKKVDAYRDKAEYDAIKWDDLMISDPRKGVKQFAGMLGDAEGFVAGNAIEDLFDPAGNAMKALGTLKRGSKAADLAEAVDAVTPPGQITKRLAERGSSRIVRSGTKPARTPIDGMGNLNEDQLDFMSSTVDRLNKKFGVDIEIQARPVNAYSAGIEGGIGKVEAVPTKNLTPDDVLMGAPQEWLGQTAYYKPALPKGFEKLKGVDKQRIQLRYDEKLKEYKQFKGLVDDPTGKAAKVKKMLKPGGADVDLGQNYKGRIELAAIEREGATLIQYKKLVVNGSPVFTGKPRPIVSDIDFNAIVDRVSGKHLPAAIRGQVELELMNEFSKAQRSGLIPFGFHGWTHSGFDAKSTDFRYIAKYMLMYATEDRALRYARHWAPKFFPELGAIADPRKYERAYRKAVESILDGYTRGKHLVKVTADGASIGPGVDPTIGLPLP